jgi:hypothetical protein
MNLVQIPNYPSTKIRSKSHPWALKWCCARCSSEVDPSVLSNWNCSKSSPFILFGVKISHLYCNCFPLGSVNNSPTTWKFIHWACPVHNDWSRSFLDILLMVLIDTTQKIYEYGIRVARQEHKLSEGPSWIPFDWIHAWPCFFTVSNSHNWKINSNEGLTKDHPKILSSS